MSKSFICQHCKNAFTKTGNREYTFCSRKCRAQHQEKHLKDCICEYCKKHFQTWPSRPGRFCSAQCRSEFGARQLKPNKRRPDTMKVSRTCKQCGITYTTTSHQVRLRGSNFCSRKCMGDYQSAKLLKTGGPNYKGGISKNNKYYRGDNWERQKRKALKRDNRQCQVCLKQVTARDMHLIDVHHIRPYRLFNGDWKSANDLSNLITLCRGHHIKIESGAMPCPSPKA